MRIFINRITELVIKHLEGGLTNEEQGELDDWLNRSNDEKELFSRLTDKEYVASQLNSFYGFDEGSGWEKVTSQYTFSQSHKTITLGKRNTWLWAAAAIFILLLGSGISIVIFTSKGKIENRTTKNNNTGQDVAAPKISKATIMLANGKTVFLDSVSKGELAEEGNVNVVKSANGEVVYQAEKNGQAETRYNMLVNPRGSEVISVVLSDGTKVWLNAESSLRYPVVFTGAERKVEVTGEAYFEVMKDPSKKFIVQSAGINTEVFGTHFNVNAYTNENMVAVTLLEGSVKVLNGKASEMLVPGQQAQAAKDIRVVNEIDLDVVMAWKNGLFSFKGADLGTIMREVSRWYDVDIEFKDKIDEKFYGDISRGTNVSALLKMLEMTGSVHFSIEGKKIIVGK